MQAQSTAFAASRKSVAAGSASAPAQAKSAKAAPVVVQLSRVNLRTFIEALDGQIASIDYVKQAGEARTLTGRLGVKAYLKGGQNKVEAADRPYLTMFDMQLRQYRTVDLSTVSAIRAQGKIINVIG